MQMLRRDDGPCDFKVLVREEYNSWQNGSPKIVVQPYMLEGRLHYVLRDTTAFEGLHVHMTVPHHEVSDIAVYMFDHRRIGDWFDMEIVKADVDEGVCWEKGDPDAMHYLIRHIKTQDRDIERVSAHLRMCARMKNIPQEPQAP